MKKIILHQISPMLGDSTISYKVELSKPMSVWEFITAYFDENPNEQHLTVRLNGNSRIVCDYTYRKIEFFDTSYRDTVVIGGRSNGGWGRMDFDLITEENKNE